MQHELFIAEPAAELHPWLERHSLRIAGLNPQMIEDLFASFAVRRDGKPAARSTYKRKASDASAFLRRSIRQGAARPGLLDDIEVVPTDALRQIDVNALPTMEVCESLLAWCSSRKPGTAPHRYAVTFALTLYLGFRPSEAAGLRLGSIDHDPGGIEISVGEAVTNPGRRYGTTDGPRTRKGTKWRQPTYRRLLDAPSPLRPYLREHLEHYRAPNAGLDDPFVTNARGNLASSDNTGRAFAIARKNALGPKWQHVTHYTFRHVHITSLLRAGVPREEVERRVGAKVHVIDSVYRGAFSTDRPVGNELDERWLASQQLLSQEEQRSRPDHQ